MATGGAVMIRLASTVHIEVKRLFNQPVFARNGGTVDGTK